MANNAPHTRTTQDYIAQLTSKAARVRRNAAKHLRHTGDPDACPALLRALERELPDVRCWETQYHLIVAMGESRCQQALPLLQRLSQERLGATMVYSAIGRALVLLSNEEGSGLSRVLEILGSDNLFLVEGALCAMACLRLIAAPAEIMHILQFAKKLPEFSPAEAQSFIKVWIAAAAAGWDESLVRPFLLECCKSENCQLVRAASASLKRRYLKWHPL